MSEKPVNPGPTVIRMVLAVLIMLSTLGLPIAAVSQPAPPDPPTRRPGESLSVGIGAAQVSLDSSATAIASGEPFGFTAKVGATSPITYLQVRLKIHHPGGRLVFQRTRIEHNLPTGDHSFHFERHTSDLDLRAGIYPTQLEVTVQDASGISEEVISTGLLIYDPRRPALDAVTVVRISAQPLAEPDGTFSSDPARNREVLDETQRLLRAVGDDSSLRLTLSIAPMLLQEWRRIANGYEYVPPSGDAQRVEADSAVPQAYATVLETLAALVAQGRVELLATGFSDPDLTALAAGDMLADVSAQYRQGLSSTYAAIESQTSSGTAPAGGRIPAEAADDLLRQELGYVIVNDSAARSDDSAVRTGVYQAADTPLVVLVADSAAHSALLIGDRPMVVERAFQRHLAESPAGPFVFITEIGSTAGFGAADIIGTASLLSRQPWVRMTLGRDAVHNGGPRIHLSAQETDQDAPPHYWEEVAAARNWSRALSAAGGEDLVDAMAARSASLIAQSSTWSHANWAFAERGRSFATAAQRAGKTRLDSVSLTLAPVRLAGTGGSVPMTIANGTDIPLTVEISARGSSFLSVKGDRTWTAELRPQENFFEVPVELQNALAGQLTVAVSAGGMVLEERNITVHASYLDRLAVIGGIILLMAGMLAFIIRRVRSTEGALYNEAEYTDHPDEH